MSNIQYVWDVEQFKQWLHTLFEPFIQEKYLGILIGNWPIFKQAFTSREVDTVVNYDLMEIIGDGVAAYVLPIYFYKRFPQLRQPDGVMMIARLKIKYASKEIFSTLAKKLGFWPWIRRAENIEMHAIREASLLEDVFEAVLGAMVLILDKHFGLDGVGVSVGYTFMAKLLDDLDISLNYTDLFDAKTRLKELMDIYKSDLGTLSYKSIGHTITHLFLGTELLATVEGPATKKQREQQVSELALAKLHKKGYYKEVKT